MRILAIDTATESCSAAVWVDGGVRAREERLERGHAARILQMVDEVLAEGGLRLPHLDAIAFGRGPGAFTGLRLAASVAQGLAFGAGLPVVPVSDLRAVAQRALEVLPDAARVLVATDARMREVYWGCFARDAEGLARAVGDERVGPPNRVRLPEAWAAEPHVAVCGAGAGFAAYPELQNVLATAPATILDSLMPQAQEIARLAALEVRAGRVMSPEQALPVYLRDDVTHKRPAGH